MTDSMNNRAKLVAIGLLALSIGPLFFLLDSRREPTSASETKSINPKNPDNAKMFSQLITGTLNQSEEKRLNKTCRTHPLRNIFCPSILRKGSILAYIRLRKKVPSFSEPKTISPVMPRFGREGIANWNELRRGDIAELLPGLSALNSNQLKVLASLAQDERRCPNHIAIAVAATQEGHVGGSLFYSDIAPLYVVGGRCFPAGSDDQENFYTRAALFFYLSKKHQESLTLLKRIKPSDAFNGRTHYWIYRNLIELGKENEAERALQTLLDRHPLAFHTALAASSKHPGFVASMMASKRVSRPAHFRSPRVNNLKDQIETLFQYGFNESAAILTGWAFDEYEYLSSRTKLYLSEFADATTRVKHLPMALHSQPNLISRHSLGLAFPKEYLALMTKYGNGNDPYLLLSIARKESLFDPHVISPANAVGLIQVSLGTSRLYTQGMMPNLSDPVVNITIGAKYLSDLLLKMGGNLAFAVASYNAGEHHIPDWRARFPTNDPVLFIDLIPYRETRNYVASVLNSYFWYLHLNNRDTSLMLRQLGVQ